MTILVALLLLTLMAGMAAGMMRNSFKEVVSSGVTRQGNQVRALADGGLSWALFWIDDQNSRNAAGGTAKSFTELRDALLQNDTLSGKAHNAANATPTLYNTQNPPTPPADLSFKDSQQVRNGMSIALTRMGKLPISDTAQGIGQGSFAPAQGGLAKMAPDLWAIRSDGSLAYPGLAGATFRHAREAWISTPVK